MKKTVKLMIVLLMMFILLITVYCIKVNAATTGIITEITVNVREKASIDSDIIMFVTQDDKVEVLGKTGDWYKIRYQNKEGYIYADFIKVEDNLKASTTKNNSHLESEDEEVTKTISPALYLTKNVGIKIAPHITSNIIYTTTKDSKVELLEQLNNWSYIQINDLYGWVRNDQIKEETMKETSQSTQEGVSNENQNKIVYVKYNNVNLRKEPSTDASIIEKLKLNTEVTILEEVDAIWNKVKVGKNTGYISKDLLSTQKQQEEVQSDTQTTVTSRDGQIISREEQNQTIITQENEVNQKETIAISKGQEIVNYAKQYLGYRYVYGGASPKTGFDCSGFTSYVYKHFGYTLSKSSVTQANQGVEVNKTDLQPGDLVIYKNTSLTKIGHVGIYIGDNKMIHASEPGVGVIITDIDSKAHNYPKRFVMGRRII